MKNNILPRPVDQLTLDPDPVLSGLLIANAIWQAVNGPHLQKRKVG